MKTETTTIETPRFTVNATTGIPNYRDSFNRVIPGIPEAAFFANQKEGEGKIAHRRILREAHLTYKVEAAKQALADFHEEANPEVMHRRLLERKVSELSKLMGSAFTAEMEAAILATPVPVGFTAQAE